MRNLKKTAAALLAAIAISLTAASEEACGQRTMDRQNMIGMEAASSCYRPVDTGMQVSWGQYGLTYYWKTWINASPWSIALESGDRMTYGQVTAGADFMCRLLSNRSRSISAYAGGGAFLGAEGYNLWHRLPSYIETDFPRGRFLYGITASAEIEAFICRNVALVLSGNAPFTISSLVRPFHFQLRLGVRVTL